MHQVTWINKQGALRSITSPVYGNAFTIYLSLRALGVKARFWNKDKSLLAN